MGSTVTGSGVTNIFDSTEQIAIGNYDFSTGGTPVAGYYHAFELRDGIDGTVVANPDFNRQGRLTTTLSDTASSPNTWQLGPDAFVETFMRRFDGEIASWQPTRDISGNAPIVEIEAAGLTRRFQQADAPARSSMYRAHTNPASTNVVAYWPLEDGSDATELASGISGYPAMEISGSPTLAAYDGWVASAAIPQMGTGTFRGAVPPYDSSGGAAEIYFFMDITSAVGSETSLLWVKTTGTARYFEVRLLANGNLRTRAYDSSQTEISDGAGNLGSELVFGLNSRGYLILKFDLAEVGSDLVWSTGINDFLATDTIADTPFSEVDISDTLTGYSFGRIAEVTIGRGGGLGSVYLSHVVVSNISDWFLSNVAKGIVAWNGEAPGARIVRICSEENLETYYVNSYLTDGTVLGDQLPNTVVDLLTEAAKTDVGMLFESREIFGIGYRDRSGFYSRAPVLALSATGDHLSDPLTPTYDDQGTVNDVTVRRVSGSSARAELTTGSLSTQDPPNGVGRYTTSVDVSLQTDATLGNQAYWRLHLGTVDEPRYGTLSVDLSADGFTDATTALALAVDVGDRIVVTDPDADLPPDDIDQLAIGYSEQYNEFQHVISYVTVPAEPWRVGISDTNDARADTGGSELASDITSSATSIDVTTTGTSRWADSATYSSDFPFDIAVGGERMTVTAISGTTTAQTFTVTRGVNGVSKAHSSGDAVELFQKTYLAL